MIPTQTISPDLQDNYIGGLVLIIFICLNDLSTVYPYGQCQHNIDQLEHFINMWELNDRANKTYSKDMKIDLINYSKRESIYVLDSVLSAKVNDLLGIWNVQGERGCKYYYGFLEHYYNYFKLISHWV